VNAKTWLLVVLLVGMASCAVLVGVVGPRFARGFVAPISKMKTEQQEFERWAEARGWREPEQPQLEAARLDAFLALRKELLEVQARGESLGRGLEGREPTIGEISGLMEGATGLVTGSLAAHRRHEMTPKEYDYLKRLVYRQWLQPLREKGLDPAARQAAARELTAAAEAEGTAAVRQRLVQIARAMHEKRPPPPDGISEPLHALLFAKAVEIQALADGESRFRGR
jgi:hypothetical protein